MYYLLQVSGRRTDGKEFGSLHAKAIKERAVFNAQHYPKISEAQKIWRMLLPTPLASDATVGAVMGKEDRFRVTATGMPRKINRNGTSGSVGLARLMTLMIPGSTGPLSPCLLPK